MKQPLTLQEKSKFASSQIGSHHWAATVLSYIMRVGEYLYEHGSLEGKNDMNYRGWGSGIKDRATEVNDYLHSLPDPEYDKSKSSHVEALEAENKRLKNDLLDALDLKEGHGPTALSMLKAEVEALRKEREWIPVGDRLPEDPNQLCIFGKWYPNWSRFINIESMLWSEFQAHRSWELKKSYTHWQHLAPNP